MTNVFEATQTIVATPYLANVLLPVAVVPANLNVTPAPWVIVCDDAELL